MSYLKVALFILFFISSAFSGAIFRANLTFRNTTDRSISFDIIKGDLYEARDQGSFVQNVMANEDLSITLNPGEIRGVELEMACIDPDRPAPEPNHEIIPTPFVAPGRPDQEDLQRRIRNAIDGVEER